MARLGLLTRYRTIETTSSRAAISVIRPAVPRGLRRAARGRRESAGGDEAASRRRGMGRNVTARNADALTCADTDGRVSVSVCSLGERKWRQRLRVTPVTQLVTKGCLTWMNRR